jgi:hypothetical protein
MRMVLYLDIQSRHADAEIKLHFLDLKNNFWYLPSTVKRLFHLISPMTLSIDSCFYCVCSNNWIMTFPNVNGFIPRYIKQVCRCRNKVRLPWSKNNFSYLPSTVKRLFHFISDDPFDSCFHCVCWNSWIRCTQNFAMILPRLFFLCIWFYQDFGALLGPSTRVYGVCFLSLQVWYRLCACLLLQLNTCF